MIAGMSVEGAACTTKLMLLRNKYEKASVISEYEIANAKRLNAEVG